MPPKRILVVEDDFLIRMTLSEALEIEGFQVLQADSGEAALVQLRSDPSIDLLMTDMQLSGGLDGQALARAVRSENTILPIIYMTGRPDRVGTIDPAREIVVGKPYTPSDICLAVRRLLDKRHV
jgi:two-component system response regulator FlrC